MTNLADNWLPRHRLTVEEFHRMGETGILRPDACVELIEGEIIDMAPIGSPHASAVARLAQLFVQALGSTAVVWIQNPIVLGDYSEPQPDLILLRPRDDFYRHALPRPADALLVVEVSDTSLRFDREVKLPLYARSNIPETWIVDLEHRVLMVYRNPADAGYRDIRTLVDPRAAAPTLLQACVLDLSDIF